MTTLKSPFPYPGGKSTIAAEVWRRLGDCPNFVEPFAGSAAVLLARPHDLTGKTETCNDLDGHIANVFRAITFDPETTAQWCDFPVSECDLTARHLHLKAAREELTSRLFADPFYFDPILAAFWLWGAASWIGDGWCVADGPWVSVDGLLVDRRTLPKEEQGEADGVLKQMPNVSGSNRAGTRDGSTVNCGIHRYRAAVPRKMPEVGTGPHSQLGGRAKGIQAVRYEGVRKKMPNVGRGQDTQGGSFESGVRRFDEPTALATYFALLSDRLRRVRFLCGGWERAVKDSITVNHGLTALFLDPPYPSAEHGMGYHGDNDIWYDVARWAAERGDDPRLRIALCGYMSDAADAMFPATWTRYAWEARGGYSNQSENGRGRANAKREMCWFSPHCIDPATDYDGTLFEGLL